MGWQANWCAGGAHGREDETMKKKLVSITLCALIACFAAFVLAGCGGGSTQSADTSASSAAATDSSAAATASSAAADATSTASASGDTFIVGFDQDYPPYGFLDTNNEYTGFDLELAQEVCNRLGWTYKPEPINWDTKQQLIDSGAITCIWNGFTMEGRESDYAFSEPYMDNGQVIMVKADSDIKALADLAGKTVGTQVDSAALEVLEGDQADLAATFAALEQRTFLYLEVRRIC